MKIVLVVVGPLFLALGLFLVGQAAGLLLRTPPYCCAYRCRCRSRFLGYSPWLVRAPVAEKFFSTGGPVPNSSKMKPASASAGTEQM